MAAERGVVRPPLADVDLALLGHERELEVLRALSELPDIVAAGHAPSGHRTRSPPGCASWPARSTASTTTATSWATASPPELTQARLWLVEAAAIGLAIGLDLLGVERARSRCERGAVG